jgi:hypothetical protein
VVRQTNGPYSAGLVPPKPPICIISLCYPYHGKQGAFFTNTMLSTPVVQCTFMCVWNVSLCTVSRLMVVERMRKSNSHGSVILILPACFSPPLVSVSYRSISGGPSLLPYKRLLAGHVGFILFGLEIGVIEVRC